MINWKHIKEIDHIPTPRVTSDRNCLCASVHLFKETKTFNLFQKSCHFIYFLGIVSRVQAEVGLGFWTLYEGNQGRGLVSVSRRPAPAVSRHSLVSLCVGRLDG